MAKIIYIGIPAHGHTNPTLPVFRELAARGHRVIHYNAESFRAKVEPTGVEFRPFPEPMPTEREIAEAMYTFINAPLVLSRVAEHLTPWVIAEVEREQPDVVVYDTVAMAGYIAARTNGIPNICSITHFVLDGSFGAVGLGTILRFVWSGLRQFPTLLGWRRRMAAKYGKENASGITEYGDLNIVFTSRAFHPPNSVIDERFRFVGASINPATRQEAFNFDLLDGRPLVYVSLGTVNNLNPDFYQATFGAFGDLPVQVLLSVGKHTDPASLGTPPENFIVRRFVPQLQILDRAAAFVTHGGMNSVHEALYYGVPQVVVPHQFEQLLNGKRVAQTETGVLLGTKYPYGRVTAGELREAVAAVLGDAGYRERAAAMGATLKAAGGYVRAADEIEAFTADSAARRVTARVGS